jgi:sugar lactone lactonase YvrE
MNKTRLITILNLLFFIVENIYAQNINTIAGNGISGNSGDGGTAITAELRGPAGIEVDGAGNVYISSYSCIRKINTSGIINTIAGSTIATGSSGSGGPAVSALLGGPAGMIVNQLGEIYFTEIFNNRVCKINTSGIISVVAGTGVAGFSGDGGLATSAKLKYPNDIALDKNGNVYIADAGNHRIRKIDSNGIISTIAGTGVNTYSGDGGLATSAALNNPLGVEVDTIGNVFIGDGSNARVRKINNSGIINTVVGTGTQGNSGDGGQALMSQIGSVGRIRFDIFGNLYIPDYYYSVIRKVTPAGIINTVTGTGTGGFSGDGGSASLSQINNIHALATDISGNLYIADMNNNRIRKVDFTTGINEVKLFNNVNIYPNPASDVLQIFHEEHIFQNSQMEIINHLGQTVLKQTYSNSIDVSKLSDGIYTLKITLENNQNYFSKFIKE